MFYVFKISLELWVSLEANNLKYYIKRLELIHFKVINFCMSTYYFDMWLFYFDMKLYYFFSNSSPLPDDIIHTVR